MTFTEAEGLRNGLYKLHFYEGGFLLAAVGRNAGGKMWAAPTNWIWRGDTCQFDRHWANVSRAELLCEEKHTQTTEEKQPEQSSLKQEDMTPIITLQIPKGMMVRRMELVLESL